MLALSIRQDQRLVKTYLALLNDFPEACLQEPPRI
jgi:hypothetical protein